MSMRNIPPINNEILITEFVTSSKIFTGAPLASCNCKTIDKITSEKISLITAAVMTVLPNLLSKIPNCIKTIVVTGTAVIDSNKPTNID